MDKRIKEIADHYGLISQLDQTTEECAELIQAINKFKRSSSLIGVSKLLFEELADVQIMIDQLIYLTNGEKAVSKEREYKIQRQLERMDGVNNG